MNERVITFSVKIDQETHDRIMATARHGETTLSTAGYLLLLEGLLHRERQDAIFAEGTE